MNADEINKEIIRDFNIIQGSSTIFRLVDEYNRERKKLKINKEKQYPIFKEFKTKAKNSWTVFLNKSETDKTYEDERNLSLMYITQMSTNNGMRFFKITPDNQIVVYNEHLFIRYNERMNLNISSTKEILKHFFTYNGHAVYKVISNNDKNDYHSIGFTQNGILLGVSLPEHSWVINRTFIRKDQAFISQNEYQEESIDYLKNLVEKEEYFSSDPIKSRILKEIFVNLTIKQ